MKNNQRKPLFFHILLLVLSIALLLSTSSCTVNLVIGGNDTPSDPSDNVSAEDLGLSDIDKPDNLNAFEEVKMLFKKGITAEEFLSHVEIVELTPENASDYLTVTERRAINATSVDETNYVWSLKEGYVPLNSVIGKFVGVMTSDRYTDGTMTTNSQELDGTLVLTVGNEEYYSIISERYRYYGDQSYLDVTVEDLQITSISGKIFKVDLPESLFEQEQKTVLREGFEGTLPVETQVLYRNLKIKPGKWYELGEYLYLSLPSDSSSYCDKLFASSILRLTASES